MEDAQDAEEHEQIEYMHVVMEELGLDRGVRWLGAKLDKILTDELYRVVADSCGAFVQPVPFEAMASGLLAFATRYGGPSEITEDGISGFFIGPNHGEVAANAMADFLSHCREQPETWGQLSAATLDRVNQHHTWALCADRMMPLSRVYGFWNYVTNVDRASSHRYLEMLHALQSRPLANSVPHR